MKISVKRTDLLKDTTIGEMFIDGVFECYTLEDKVRQQKGKKVKEWKIDSKTAIPVGIYNVVITMSPRFGVMMPLLEGVDGFAGIRIHPGNKAEDTDGCILVGTQKHIDDETIGNSRAAYYKLYKKIDEALKKKEKVTLEIS